jgi:hypothetical protein
MEDDLKSTSKTKEGSNKDATKADEIIKEAREEADRCVKNKPH